MIKNITAFNIKYKTNITYLSCCGRSALESFASKGILNAYDGKSAPTELEIEVDLPDCEDIFDLDTNLVIEKTKKVLEDETGLEVIDFGIKF